MPIYQPKSEQALVEESLYKEGEYDFEILGADDGTSRAGNEMLILKLKVFNDDDYTLLTDYIAFGSNFGERKFRHAADACGLLDVYDSGKLGASHFVGKCGKVKIKVQEGNAQYPDPKNVVNDYVKREGDMKHRSGSAKELDDSIPF